MADSASSGSGRCRRCSRALVAEPGTGLCVSCLAENLHAAPAAGADGPKLPPGYEYVEVLGRGGMGEVYLVFQRQLGRYVALKRAAGPRVHDPRTEERFLREARAAARLSHPAIVSILEVGTEPGEVWYTMEYVEGGDLARWLERRGGSVPWRDAVRVVAQVAAAIAHAHAAGIAHRDLKLSNILLDAAGAPKVADFGLAWLAQREAGELTRSGEVLGTPAYLPPEAIGGGARGADPRAGDIYALGVLLFHLVAGRPPFAGEQTAEMLHAIVHTAAPRLSAVAAQPVPPVLDEICACCLSKAPAQRYRSAAELVAALEGVQRGEPVAVPGRRRRQLRRAALGLAVAAVAGAGLWAWAWQRTRVAPAAEPGVQTMAVGPVETIGTDEAAAALAGGLQDEIVATLMRVTDLRVIAPRSVRALGSGRLDPHAVRATLGADAVLEGRIRRVDDKVWVAMQLTGAEGGAVLWSRTYIARETNALNLQTDIATDVAVRLHRQLRAELMAPGRGTSSLLPEAQAAFTQGRALLNDASASVDYLKKAEVLLEQAAAADPAFALAQAELSLVHTQMYIWGNDRTERRLARGLEAAQQAKRLNPDLVEAEIALGLYYYRGSRDYETALAHYQRALTLAPNHPDVLQALAQVERRRGDFATAGRHFEAALRLDPLNAILAYNTADTYLRLRDYPHASGLLESALQRRPRHVALVKLRGDLYVAWKGDLGPMREDIEQRDPRLPTPELYVMDRINYLILRHELETALGVLRASPLQVLEGESIYLTRAGYESLLLDLAGQHDAARAAARKALPGVERELAQRTNDPRLLLHAGQLRSILGDFAQAEALARRTVTAGDAACVDAFDRGYYLRSLAVMEASAGRDELARETLRTLLSLPDQTSQAFVALHPALERLAQKFP